MLVHAVDASRSDTQTTNKGITSDAHLRAVATLPRRGRTDRRFGVLGGSIVFNVSFNEDGVQTSAHRELTVNVVRGCRMTRPARVRVLGASLGARRTTDAAACARSLYRAL